MQYTLKAPAQLRCDIKLPASKSISNRVLVIHALRGGGIEPENLSDCDDTEVVMRALRDNPYEINIKAAGTAMRFMTAYLSVTEGEHVITGTERMKHRPIQILVDALQSIGAEIEYVGEEGYPPLRISGKRLNGGTLEISGSTSSQYITALLLVAPALRDGLTLHLSGEIISRPYIDLTLCTMREFGISAEWTSHDTITVKHGTYSDMPYYIENDWSAASYWYEMMALCDDAQATVRLEGLKDGSRQGDSQLRYIFSLLGVKTSFEVDANDSTRTTVVLRRNRCPLRRLDYDFSGCPDLAQTFVVTCCMLGLPFRFEGLSTLKIKETDRIEALKTELRKLGFVLQDENGSILLWDGTRCNPDASMGIDTYEDHRMAMALAPAAFKTEGLKINNPEVVSKSYPSFWKDLEKAGFVINE